MNKPFRKITPDSRSHKSSSLELLCFQTCTTLPEMPHVYCGQDLDMGLALVELQDSQIRQLQSTGKDSAAHTQSVNKKKSMQYFKG